MEEKQSTFEELCLPHLDAAYSLARLLVGKDEDAQDLVQEAYVRAWKGFKGFRGDNARAWLMMIVRNTAYSWLKKHANEANMVPFDPRFMPQLQASCDPSPAGKSRYNNSTRR